MADDPIRYSCLYTHQKTKKRKTWQDGLLHVFHGACKLVLHDDSGKRVLDVLTLQPAEWKKEFSGEEFEFERYLVSEIESSQSLAAPETAPRQEPAQLPMPRKRVGLGGRSKGFRPPSSISPAAATRSASEPQPSGPPLQLGSTSPPRARPVAASRAVAAPQLPPEAVSVSKPFHCFGTEVCASFTSDPTTSSSRGHIPSLTLSSSSSSSSPSVASAAVGATASTAPATQMPRRSEGPGALWFPLPEHLSKDHSCWAPLGVPTHPESLFGYVTALARMHSQTIAAALVPVATGLWEAITKHAPGVLESRASLTAASLSSLCSAARSNGCALYTHARLIRLPRKAAASSDGPSAKRSKGAAPREPAEVDELSKQLDPFGDRRPRLYLEIDASQREKSTSYSLGEAWIVSTTLAFRTDAPSNCRIPASSGGKGGAQAGRDFVFFARSAFHAPSQRHWLELQPLPALLSPPSQWPAPFRALMTALARGEPSARTSAVSTSDLPTVAGDWPILDLGVGPDASIAVCAARLGDACSSTDVSIVEALTGVLAAQGGGAPHLIPPVLLRGVCALEAMSGPLADCHPAQVRDAVEFVTRSFGLNADQKAVLERVAEWVTSGVAPSAPAVLVHGVFGAGKSTLLSAVVVFLHSLLGKTKHRILLAANTNTAVDNVLSNLRRRGFDRFCRYGSVKKIAKPILPFTLNSDSSTESLSRLEAEFKEIRASLVAMSDGGPSQDIADCDRAIANCQAKAALVRQELANAFLVGTTCVATSLPALQGKRFSIVLLDEASQMVEPLAMLPLARFGASCFVAVGDPKQLPPALPSLPGATDTSPAQVTMFERLAVACPEWLSTMFTQYRCHPTVVSIASRLFYAGALKSGTDASHHAPLLRPLAPVSFLDTATAPLAPRRPPVLERSSGRSWINPGEACLCAELVAHLVCRCRVQPSQVGVICLYRSQAAQVSHFLSVLASTIMGGSSQHPNEEEGTPSTAEAMAMARSSLSRAKAGGLVAAARTLKHVQVSTVDAFQGAEKDVIIVATTRTVRGSDQSLQFLDDPRRTNVALTRAKRHLIVVGLASLVATTRFWSAALASARRARDAGSLTVPTAFASEWGIEACDTVPEETHLADAALVDIALPEASQQSSEFQEDDDEDFV
jgi:hypothetical protein